VNPVLLVHPEWTSGLAIAVLGVTIAVALARRNARQRARRLLGASTLPRGPVLRSDLALLAALAAVALALLGPRIGERTVWLPGSGVDVVFLLDLSRSMDATDVPPSRLDRARRATEEILARLSPSDRGALAAFSARGVLLTPLTPDRNALVELLSGLHTDLIAPASSGIAAGVRAALSAFEAGSERPRVIVVLSDGEFREGDRDLAASEAVAEQVRIVTAALGSEVGGQVRVGGRMLTDIAGRPVVSRRRIDRLDALAAATGGASFVGDPWGRFDFERAAAAIRRDAATTTGELIPRRVRAVHVAPLAALAFLLLLVEGLPRPRRLRGPAAIPFLLALLALAPTALDPGDSAAAGTDSRAIAAPDESQDARTLIDLGLADLERGRSEAAARAFLAATIYARNVEVAAVAHFDLGVASLGDGDLEGARDAFYDALAANPGDDEARFNLEWTLDALAQHPPPIAPSAPGDSKGSAAKASRSEDTRRSVESEGPVVPLSLSAEKRRRWLERTRDDPRRWLKTVAEAAGGDTRRSQEPAW